MVVSWADFQQKLRAYAWEQWACPVSRIGPHLTVCWKSRYIPVDWPVLAEITPLNIRLISMGSVVHEPSCFLSACLKFILASSFISFFSFQYFCIASLSFTSHGDICLPLLFLQDLAFPPSFPRRHQKRPWALTPPHLPTPLLHPPALWTGSSTVTKRDTALWPLLVNVSTTSSLKQRGKNP